MQSSFDSCYNAVTSSLLCVDEHMVESDMKKCDKLCLDTIAIATACASMCAAKSDSGAGERDDFMLRLILLDIISVIAKCALTCWIDRVCFWYFHQERESTTFAFFCAVNILYSLVLFRLYS